MPEEDLVELRFRLFDGTDIGPIRYSSASTVAMLKERIITDWPRGCFLILNLKCFDFFFSLEILRVFFRVMTFVGENEVFLYSNV